jgi:hypothetical protein
MSDDGTIETTAERADYERGRNTFFEGELTSCPPDASPAFALGWARAATEWREYEMEQGNRYGWGWGGSS